MSDEQKVEFWAQQAMMWHEKYKSVLALEEEHHRFQVALEKLAEASNSVTRERVRAIAQRALRGN